MVVHRDRAHLDHDATWFHPSRPMVVSRPLVFAFAFVLVVLGCGAGTAPAANGARSDAPVRHAGHVTFADDEVTWRGGSRSDREAVREAAVQLLESWCALDAASYRAHLAPAVTRINRVTGISRGVDAVLASLPREWEEMERPNGTIAVDLVVDDARIEIAGDYAFATYAVAVESQEGIRWEFSDRWLVHQVFERTSYRRWQLLHQSLASDLDAEGDEPSFEFAFALPVTDLSRAVAFYTPLVGTPEHVSGDRAWFRVGAVRFILDAGGLGGFARVRPERPNGYVTFPVDVLADADVAPIARLATPEGDSAAVCLDPAGNVFVLLVERFGADGPAPETIWPPGLPGPAARALVAWMRGDARAYAAAFAPNGTWFDNTRSNLEVISSGRDAIQRRVTALARGFDRSVAGISARLAVRDLAIAPAGSCSIVTFRLQLTGLGNHPFRDDAFVTMILEADRVRSLFTVRHLPEALVREFDYIGYPTQGRAGEAGLDAVERFYRRRLELGTPYTDDSWYGFWGSHAVFGLFEADRVTEGFPVPRTANGYPSFWVASARRTEAYLRERGSRFPVTPSINAGSGPDRKPGYTDLLATDPDGNLILFTEYSGR